MSIRRQSESLPSGRGGLDQAADLHPHRHAIGSSANYDLDVLADSTIERFRPVPYVPSGCRLPVNMQDDVPRSQAR